jgi:hypothetical protein
VQTQFGILTAQTLQLCAFISIEHSGSIPTSGRLALEAHPTPQDFFTDTDLGGHMRHRPTGLNHQTSRLLPKLRGVLLALARHTDILPAGPAIPPVRCPPSGINPRREGLGGSLLHLQDVGADQLIDRRIAHRE